MLPVLAYLGHIFKFIILNIYLKMNPIKAFEMWPSNIKKQYRNPGQQKYMYDII